MDIELKGIKGIIGKVNALEKTLFAPLMMNEIGLYLLTRIKERTLAGQDVNGIAFDPYSSSYKKWRKKKGYKTSPVDLFLSGSMLSAMTHTATSTSAELFFMNTSDDQDTKNPDKAFWNNEDREFFALSPDDIKGIMNIVGNYYEKLMGRRTLR